MPTFRYILADSGIFRILAQIDIFMYIKSYSEPMVYSGIFGNIDIFSQFQARYSGITHDQFMLNMLTLNLIRQIQVYLKLWLI